MTGVLQGSSIKWGKLEPLSPRSSQGWLPLETTRVGVFISDDTLTVSVLPKTLELEPVHGDVLPPVGEKVLIHLARRDEWVVHTVVGYYVWPMLDNAPGFRVNVRVRDSEGYLNARSLEDIRTLDGSWYVHSKRIR